MLYIHKNPSPNSVATIRDFETPPGAPWQPYDAANEAWLAAARSAFAPPQTTEDQENADTTSFQSQLQDTIAKLQDNNRAQALQVTLLCRCMVKVLRRLF